MPLLEETLLGEVALAVAALHALDVPLSVQHVEQEAVQDGPLAARTARHGPGGGKQPSPRPVVLGQRVQGTHLDARQVHRDAATHVVR